MSETEGIKRGVSERDRERRECVRERERREAREAGNDKIVF